MPLDSATHSQLADFSALDEQGRPALLSSLAAEGALVLLVHRGLAHAASVALLVEYRDRALSLRARGVRIAALSDDDAASLAFLRSERGIPFPMLSDPGRSALSLLGPWAPGGTAALLLDRRLHVLFRARAPLGSSGEVLGLILRGVTRVRRPFFPRVGAAFRVLRALLRPRLPAS